MYFISTFNKDLKDIKLHTACQRVTLLSEPKNM